MGRQVGGEEDIALLHGSMHTNSRSPGASSPTQYTRQAEKIQPPHPASKQNQKHEQHMLIMPSLAVINTN